MRNPPHFLTDFTNPDAQMESLYIVLYVKNGDFERRKYKTVMLLRILALK